MLVDRNIRKYCPWYSQHATAPSFSNRLVLGAFREGAMLPKVYSGLSLRLERHLE